MLTNQIESENLFGIEQQPEVSSCLAWKVYVNIYDTCMTHGIYKQKPASRFMAWNATLHFNVGGQEAVSFSPNYSKIRDWQITMLV